MNSLIHAFSSIVNISNHEKRLCPSWDHPGLSTNDVAWRIHHSPCRSSSPTLSDDQQHHRNHDDGVPLLPRHGGHHLRHPSRWVVLPPSSHVTQWYHRLTDRSWWWFHFLVQIQPGGKLFLLTWIEFYKWIKIQKPHSEGLKDDWERIFFVQPYPLCGSKEKGKEEMALPEAIKSVALIAGMTDNELYKTNAWFKQLSCSDID